MAPRIAVGGFLHETNTFAPSKATYDHFVQGGGWPAMSEGEAMFAAVANVNVGASGFIEAARAAGWEVVPLVWAAASPSAHVTEDAYERIAGRMLDCLAAAGPVDAVYLDLHGAMVCEHLDDGEGEILARVRRLIGEAVPLVASLDLHGNVTQAMVDAADALVAFRTYPHVDMAETGKRSATYLAKILGGNARHAKAFRRIDYLMPIAWQATSMEPCKTLYAELAATEGEAVPMLSFLPGFPAADFPDCGPTIVSYGITQADADAAANRLAALVAARESAFDGEVLSPEDGVARAMAIAAAGAIRPVVIADTQDNPGAGGDSNTTGMLRALVAANAQRAAIGLIVDPEAAVTAHEAGEGATIRLAIGGRSGITGDTPFIGEFVVERLSGGHLTASGPFYGGSRMNLGPSACLRIGGVRIVLASRKAQLADQEMYRFVGIEPTSQAILVNKSSVHFRADFEPIAETILVCAAPGPMPVSPAALPWTRLRPGIRIAPNGPTFSSDPHTK